MIRGNIEIYKTLNDIDLIIHLGDLWNDGKRIKDQLNVPLIGLKGNMDGSFARDGYHIMETEFGKIFLAHGHMENVKQGYDNLMYKAESLECKRHSLGILTSLCLFRFQDVSIKSECYFQPEAEKDPMPLQQSEKKPWMRRSCLRMLRKHKAESGFLKSVLNDSDRF